MMSSPGLERILRYPGVVLEGSEESEGDCELVLVG